MGPTTCSKLEKTISASGVRKTFTRVSSMRDTQQTSSKSLFTPCAKAVLGGWGIHCALIDGS